MINVNEARALCYTAQELALKTAETDLDTAIRAAINLGQRSVTFYKPYGTLNLMRSIATKHGYECQLTDSSDQRDSAKLIVNW